MVGAIELGYDVQNITDFPVSNYMPLVAVVP